MEVTWHQLDVWCFILYKMSYILFPERLKKPHSYMWELELWALLLLKFFFPEKVFKSLPLLCSAFSWQYVRTTHWDHLGNACVTSVGAAHGGSWFQLTPSSCQLNTLQRWWMLYCSHSLWDQCCCWLARLLACLESQTWILLGRGACERWGRCSKYCLYVWLCIDFCCFTVVGFFSKKDIWSEFVPPLLSTVIHPPRSFFS